MGKRLNNWYIADTEGHELFADLDLRHSKLKRLSIARARLYGAIEAGALDVEFFAFYASETAYHYHLMVRLRTPISAPHRLLWENRLCDDFHRNNMNTARLLATGRSWSLLITPNLRHSYPRAPDFTCSCPAKHKDRVMADCPIARQLDCVLSVDHFGRPIYREESIILGRPVYPPPRVPKLSNRV